MTERAEFLGLPFDRLSFDAAVAWLAARGADHDYGYVVTPNVDHMVRLADAPVDVTAAYHGAALCLCDSRVLARLARFAGVSLPVVPGSDLTAALFARVLRDGDRLCLIGGAAEDAARLRALHPALDIVHHQPPMGLRTDSAARAEAARAAAAAGARITLLAVGSPQQEMLAR
ncbi:MAG: WecB/TagA/CpsF family glycosyltransferase, partial [Sphingomonas bacterium]